MGLDYDPANGWIWQASGDSNNGEIVTVDPEDGSYTHRFYVPDVVGTPGVEGTGVHYDGDDQYLYVTEWDMNRYLPDGTKDSSAGFDNDSYGSCFAEGFLWTLCEDGLIHCWSVQEWPDLEEVTSAAFSPPADSCRGLWHDGDYFWSAQAFESAAGNIYRFDSEGTVIDQWQAPAFTGWSACVYDGYPSSLNPATWGEIKSSMH